MALEPEPSSCSSESQKKRIDLEELSGTLIAVLSIMTSLPDTHEKRVRINWSRLLRPVLSFIAISVTILLTLPSARACGGLLEKKPHTFATWNQEMIDFFVDLNEGRPRSYHLWFVRDEFIEPELQQWLDSVQRHLISIYVKSHNDPEFLRHLRNQEKGFFWGADEAYGLETLRKLKFWAETTQNFTSVPYFELELSRIPFKDAFLAARNIFALNYQIERVLQMTPETRLELRNWTLTKKPEEDYLQDFLRLPILGPKLRHIQVAKEPDREPFRLNITFGSYEHSFPHFATGLNPIQSIEVAHALSRKGATNVFLGRHSLRAVIIQLLLENQRNGTIEMERSGSRSEPGYLVLEADFRMRQDSHSTTRFRFVICDQPQCTDAVGRVYTQYDLISLIPVAGAGVIVLPPRSVINRLIRDGATKLPRQYWETYGGWK